MTKIRLALSRGLAADNECSRHVINCVRQLEQQYDDLFELAEAVVLSGGDDGIAALLEFLAAQVRRFPQED